MKAVFITLKPSSPSYEFYKEAFNLLNKFKNIINIDFVTGKYDDKIFFNYDIAIFMGGSINKDKAKEINPNIKIVVVDSRAGHNDNLENIDLLICNGIEMQILHQKIDTEFFIYPTYPKMQNIDKLKNNKKIKIGYHGNKVHLETIYPKISKAIYNLSLKYEIEFFAMYNIKKFKKSKIISKENLGCHVEHIDFSYDNYNKISEVDIGLVPQLIPIYDNIFTRSLFNKYNENKNDYILRFKDTNNFGRHLVFAQYKIPVVTDVTPSSCQLITHGKNGFFAYSSSSWQKMIEILICNREKRLKMGEEFYLNYKENFSHEILNKQLLKKFISIYDS